MNITFWLSLGITLAYIIAFTPLNISFRITAANKFANIIFTIKIAGIPINIRLLIHYDNGLVVNFINKRGRVKRSKTYSNDFSSFDTAISGAIAQLKLVKGILKALTLENIALHARLGTGDAAATALCSGIIVVLVKYIAARANIDAKINILPEYSKKEFVIEYKMSLRLRTGRMLYWLIPLAAKNIKEKRKTWTNTRASIPSKA